MVEYLDIDRLKTILPCVACPLKYTYDTALPCGRHYCGCALNGLTLNLTGTDCTFPPWCFSVGNTPLCPCPLFCLNPLCILFGTSWARAGAVAEKANPGQKALLFRDKIEPRDIAQGSVGDCWLLAGLACLAERPNAVRALFVDDLEAENINTMRYRHLRLFNPGERCWDIIEVDDWIPTLKDNVLCLQVKKDPGATDALSAKPNEAETWVMVVEKAVAKLCNSYASLSGGETLWALHVFTSCTVRMYEKDGDWTEKTLYYPPCANRQDAYMKNTGNAFSDNDLFFRLKTWDSNGYFMCASKRRNNGSDNAAGLVPGHAYALIAVREAGGHKLLRLRNPWGKFEWKQRWSDEDVATWEANPEVKAACNWSPDADKDDGAFWMSFEDFSTMFTHCGVCMCGPGEGAEAEKARYEQNIPSAPAQFMMKHVTPATRCLVNTANWWCMGGGPKNVCACYFPDAAKHNNDIPQPPIASAEAAPVDTQDNQA